MTADRHKVVNLNSAGYTGSFTGDLAWDSVHRLLYAVDQSNARLAVIDEKTGRVVSSAAVGKAPFAIALSPDAATVYVTEKKTLYAPLTFATLSSLWLPKPFPPRRRKPCWPPPIAFSCPTPSTIPSR